MNETFGSEPATTAAGVRGLLARFSLKLAIVLMLLGSTPARAAPPSVTSYMDCARAIGVAIDNKFAVVFAERFDAKGLYVYTDQSAVFLRLGAPHIENGKANEFFLLTNLYGIGDVYFNFREEKPGNRLNALSSIGYQTTPPGNRDLSNYRVTPATGSFDDLARDVLSTRLQERVATIKAFVDSKNAFSTPEDARIAFENDRVIYRAKLERCRVEGDRGLNYMVSQEMHKLETGLPGATIWETQIGGNQRLGASRKNGS